MKLKFITMLSLVFVLMLSSFSMVQADTKDRKFSIGKDQGFTTIAKKENKSGVYLKVTKGKKFLVSVFADANKGKGKRKWVNVSGVSGGSLGTYVTAGKTYRLTNYAVERYGKNVPIRILVENRDQRGSERAEFLWSPDSR
ncbi:hypothetical protein [Bacillus sp. 18-5]|uniref:hypothetical protein n=1 Tax=Bacillus sp. 18-5 TaxID=3458701 RepID=UPI0040457F9F